MKTLRKLFYVACTTFFLTSCEETYNDKACSGQANSVRNMARISNHPLWI